MNTKRILYLLLIFLVAGVGTLAGFGVGTVVSYKYLSNQADSEPVVTPTQVQPTVSSGAMTSDEPSQVLLFSSSEIETAVTQAVEKIGPAVVTVIGVIPTTNYWLYQVDESTASGSGVIISDGGYILTNNHVVEDMSDISVILADGTELPAEVVSTDPYADLAVLKVDGIMPAVAVFGSSDNLKPGETVIAIGSPLGSFKNSVTVGVVSATGRSLDTGSGYQMEDMIQTDASINPGNSGGPLVNLAGEVVGINTLIVREGSGTTAEGLGFAVPSSLATTISTQIIENGFFARPNLGIRWQTISPSIARRYGLPVEYGAYVIEVQRGSPAEVAGIQASDIITCIADTCIDADHLYYNILFEHEAGETVKITLARGNETKNLEVTLGQGTTN
ncbi:MAG: trypsin-like peptidase domain-containing protein [Chloroflexi bacterium]|nr:trypsin-like peptidase domain-containing protein [Chloroflexota bacterium]